MGVDGVYGIDSARLRMCLPLNECPDPNQLEEGDTAYANETVSEETSPYPTLVLNEGDPPTWRGREAAPSYIRTAGLERNARINQRHQLLSHQTGDADALEALAGLGALGLCIATGAETFGAGCAPLLLMAAGCGGGSTTQSPPALGGDAGIDEVNQGCADGDLQCNRLIGAVMDRTHGDVQTQTFTVPGVGSGPKAAISLFTDNQNLGCEQYADKGGAIMFQPNAALLYDETNPAASAWSSYAQFQTTAPEGNVLIAADILDFEENQFTLHFDDGGFSPYQIVVGRTQTELVPLKDADGNPIQITIAPESPDAGSTQSVLVTRDDVVRSLEGWDGSQFWIDVQGTDPDGSTVSAGPIPVNFDNSPETIPWLNQNKQGIPQPVQSPPGNLMEAPTIVLGSTGAYATWPRTMGTNFSIGELDVIQVEGAQFISQTHYILGGTNLTMSGFDPSLRDILRYQFRVRSLASYAPNCDAEVPAIPLNVQELDAVVNRGTTGENWVFQLKRSSDTLTWNVWRGVGVTIAPDGPHIARNAAGKFLTPAGEELFAAESLTDADGNPKFQLDDPSPNCLQIAAYANRCTFGVPLDLPQGDQYVGLVATYQGDMTRFPTPTPDPYSARNFLGAAAAEIRVVIGNR